MATQLLAGLVPEFVKLDLVDKKDKAAADDQTEYQIRPLNGMQYAQVITLCSFKDGMILVTDEAVPLLIKWGLTGWRNMLGADGNEVDFDRSLVSMVPGVDLFSLSKKIFNKSMLAEGEKKT